MLLGLLVPAVRTVQLTSECQRRYERLGLPQPIDATDTAIAACTVLDTEAGMRMARENGRGGVVDLVQRSKWIDGLNKYKAAQELARRKAEKSDGGPKL